MNCDDRASLPSGLAGFDLSGRTALVTGSTRGLGRVLAEGLLAAGAEVVLHGRDPAAAAALADELSGPDHAVRSIAFDVTAAADVARGVGEVESLVGTPDIVVNNAGVQRRAPIAEFTDRDWDDLLATNLTGTFLVSRAVARGMIERGSGRIINIGSVQSQLARPSIAAYSATKGAIAMFTKGLCADLAPHGINVNAIAPGYFATELTRPLVEDTDFSSWVGTRTPAGRWGRAEELVGAAVFLASAASSFVNGQILYVDGGMTAVV